MKSSLGIFVVFFSYMIYSAHDGLIKYIGSNYHPFQISFFAFLIGFVPVMVYVIALKDEGLSLRPKNWKLLGLRGLFAALNTPIVMYAFTEAPVTEVYTLIFCTPIWVTILSVFFLGERIKAPRIIAIISGLLGVVIILNPRVTNISIGHLAAFISSLLSSGTVILMRKLGGKENPITIFLFAMFSIFFLAGINLPFVYRPMPFEDFFIMTLIGLFSLSAGLLMQWGYKLSEANLIAPIQYTQLIWGILLSYFVFNEVIKSNVYYGIPFILGSGLIILWRESTMKTKANATKSQWRSDIFQILNVFRKEKK